MPRLMSVKDYIAHLTRAEAEARTALERTTLALMEVCAEKSRNMLGVEHAEWPPLAASTVAEKTRLGLVGRYSETDPEYRTGAMKDSIKASVELQGSVVKGAVTADTPYAVDQEQGSKRTPPRPFLSPPILTIEPLAKEVYGRLAVALLTPGEEL